MRLYQHPMSSNSPRVRMTAHALGLELDLVEVNLMDEGARRRLQELNPNNKIPVLQDGDFVLTESHAMMQYLCEQVPGQTLYPADIKARADVNRWLFWSAQHWQPTLSVFAKENYLKEAFGFGVPDQAALDAASAELARLAAVLDKHLAGRQWLVGDAPTLADFAVTAPLIYLEKGKMPLKSHANIMAHLARVQALPAWQAVSTGL